MKTQIFALLLSLTTLTAWAGNEGPQAEPTEPRHVIAQIFTGSMFVPQDEPTTRTLDILADGTIEATKGYGNSRQDVQVLAKLSTEVLSNLKSLIEATQPGELIDLAPNRPGCMDAPTTTYYVILTSGEKIALAKNQACKKYEKKNTTSGDYKIKSLLDGLNSLAYLK